MTWRHPRGLAHFVESRLPMTLRLSPRVVRNCPPAGCICHPSLTGLPSMSSVVFHPGRRLSPAAFVGGVGDPERPWNICPRLNALSHPRQQGRGDLLQLLRDRSCFIQGLRVSEWRFRTHASLSVQHPVRIGRRILQDDAVRPALQTATGTPHHPPPEVRRTRAMRSRGVLIGRSTCVATAAFEH